MKRNPQADHDRLTRPQNNPHAHLINSYNRGISQQQQQQMPQNLSNVNQQQNQGNQQSPQMMRPQQGGNGRPSHMRVNSGMNPQGGNGQGQAQGQQQGQGQGQSQTQTQQRIQNMALNIGGDPNQIAQLQRSVRGSSNPIYASVN